MTSILELVYSLPFVAGAVVGVIVMRTVQFMQARAADRRDPLPDGCKRKVPRIGVTWLGGLLSLAVLGYVLLQVDTTERHYRELGSEVRRCQIEFNSALVARSKITTENDQLSREQRSLLADAADAQNLWISRIINLPPDIADLPDGDPRVTQYGRTVTRVYFERFSKILIRVREIDKRQLELDQERAAHPLPEPSCGH